MTARGKQRRQILDTLRELELLAPCSDEELGLIDRLGTYVEIPPGRVLMTEGGGAIECVIIAQGRAEVTRGSRHIAAVGPGTIIGEMGLLDASPRTATVTASTPMKVFVLSAGEFHTLLSEAPCVASAIQSLAQERRRVARAVAQDAEASAETTAS